VLRGVRGGFRGQHLVWELQQEQVEVLRLDVYYVILFYHFYFIFLFGLIQLIILNNLIIDNSKIRVLFQIINYKNLNFNFKNKVRIQFYIIFK